MTTRAAARALKPRPPAVRVAQIARVGIKIAHVADVSDDGRDFRRIKPEWRHGRARDSVGQHSAQILVRGSAPQLASAQIHAADLSTIRSMASRALRGVNLRAIANIGGRIRDRAILSAAHKGTDHAQ